MIFLLKVLHWNVKDSCTTHTDFLGNVLFFLNICEVTI